MTTVEQPCGRAPYERRVCSQEFAIPVSARLANMAVNRCVVYSQILSWKNGPLEPVSLLGKPVGEVVGDLVSLVFRQPPCGNQSREK